MFLRPRARLLGAVLRDCVYVFEPIVRFADRQAIGYEALLRPRARCRFRSADEIFRRSERLGNARALDELATAKAVRQFERLAAGSDVALFFNLHNRALDETRRGGTVRNPVDPHRGIRLCLEISEQTPVDPARFERYLERWTDRPKIALDDFGTGHSGLARLVRFRPDYVKIDRLFVSGIETEPKVASRLARIVDLIHDSDAVAIVEGIETERAFELCGRAGCDLAQGFLFGDALAPPDPAVAA